jgi:tetratricopeptide (TPR) repeat protein
VVKAIAKRPEDRYVSVKALSADVAQFLERRPVHARRSSFGRRVRTLAGSHRRRAAATLVLSAVVIAGSLIAGVPGLTPRGDSASPRLPRGGTTNAAAAQAYQEGRKLWDTRIESARAAAAFRRAIAADPRFALAHVGLADTLAMWQVPSPESERALAEAFRLEPSLGEAYATQGFLRMFHYWDWVGAEESLRRAIELAPDYATAHHWQGTLFAITRRFDAAETALRRATELAPAAAVILGDLGLAAHWRGDHARAAEICERARRLDASSFVTGCLLSVYPRQGRYRDAAQLRGNTLLAVFEQQGYRAMLGQLLAAAQAMGYGGMYDATLLHAELGQKAAAIDALHRLILTHHFMAPFVNVAPALQELRGDPEFQQALRAMGLADSGRR